MGSASVPVVYNWRWNGIRTGKEVTKIDDHHQKRRRKPLTILHISSIRFNTWDAVDLRVVYNRRCW